MHSHIHPQMTQQQVDSPAAPLLSHGPGLSGLAAILVHHVTLGPAGSHGLKDPADLWGAMVWGHELLQVEGEYGRKNTYLF